jgi:hypothetical protein
VAKITTMPVRLEADGRPRKPAVARTLVEITFINAISAGINTDRARHRLAQSSHVVGEHPGRLVVGPQ